MSFPLDGSCDRELGVKGLEDLEFGGWKRTTGPEGDEMEIEATDL